MKRRYLLTRNRRRSKARERLRRIRSTGELIRRLKNFQDGRVFTVDTQPLKWNPPCLRVVENHEGVLLYAKEVATLASALDRKLIIRTETKQLNYFI
jgi:hypothetical protein